MADVAQIITEEAVRNGLPAYIPLTIAMNESGMNPKAVGDNGTSFGLFQLHRGGLAPSGMTADQMFDPAMNAQIAIPKMVGAYKAGVLQGMNGFDLVAYTANNSAWPGNIGVDSTEAKRYQAGLKRAYDMLGGAPPVSPANGSESISSFSNVSMLDLTLIGVALVILLAAFF